MDEKLNNLKLKHEELNKEYGEIYSDGMSREEQMLLEQMRPIETTFQQLGMNVFTYKIKK